MVACDKWVAIKVFEVLLCISCVVCKRVTDDEATRLSLYLQKYSREWSLLRNVTWDSVGASFADAIYGGYTIITFGLLLGRIFRELPQGRRIVEGFLLGMGAIFFIILGGLELASVDSVPGSLIDNAAVLGVLSLVTALIFLIDLAAPRVKSTSKHCQTDTEKNTNSYPTLPKHDTKKPKADDKPAKPKFFPEKFKKADKKEKLKNVSEAAILKEKEANESKDRRVEEKSAKDEVDNFIVSQSSGYHKFADDNADALQFETMEKTKFGSFRNGESKSIENNVFQKMAPRENIERRMSQEKMISDEMERNADYLKRLEERNALDKLQAERIVYEQNLAKLNEKYLKEYQQKLAQDLEYEKKGYPKMGVADYGVQKGKNWENFEDENFPPFPVRHDYLPELQTPVFARVKDAPSNKSYGVYDNLSTYSVKNKSIEDNTLRSTKPPTMQQIAEYFGLEKQKSNKKETAVQVDDDLPNVSFRMRGNGKLPGGKQGNGNAFTEGPSSPTDHGYVQYTAQHWDERLSRKYSSRTPQHSPTDE